MITQSRLQELLTYDADTGQFTWNVSRGTAKAGSSAGTVLNGYIQIRVDGRGYKAHRLAWFYTYGVWPTAELDHINHVRTDNRLENLREATATENRRNQTRHSNNTSGTTGVYWHKQTSKWQVQIKVDGKAKHLGTFTSKDDAIAARAAANALHNFHPNHGAQAA